MKRFIEISAEGMDAVKGVITLHDHRDARYIVSVDVTGLTKDDANKKTRRAGEVFSRFLGGGQRVLVMTENEGRPDARVFVLDQGGEPSASTDPTTEPTRG